MSQAVEHIFVDDLALKAGLEPLTENVGEGIRITDDSISRPSLALSGTFEFLKEDRIQAFGNEEMQMLDRQIVDGTCDKNIHEYLNHNLPMLMFSRGLVPDKAFLNLCEEKGIPVYMSELTTTMLIGKVSQILREYFAPQVSVHGVMLDVMGLGVLIQGRSSIGKSETALELISRGNSQLVSDDRVVLYENEPGMLIARPPKILERLIEIRGIGIVDVLSMYGGGAYKPTKRLSLVIELHDWDSDFKYNRIGADVEYIRFLDTQIARIVLPVHTGRNVANLIEAAALNHQLKGFGINTAEEFTTRLTEAITENKVVDTLGE